MNLFQHQKDGIEKVIQMDGLGAFFWDVGVGKTLGALKVFEHYRKKDPSLKMFVVCPISLIESSWADDIKKFTDFTYSNLRKTDDLSSDILIVNFETLISKKFRPLLQRCTRTKNRLIGIVDESQRIMTHNSKTTTFMLFLAKFFKYRLLLSATPAPNSNLEYWSQMEFLLPKLLGSTFFSFRCKFFHLKRGKSEVPLIGLGKKELSMMQQRGYKLELIKEKEKLFMERMKPYCQFVDKRDALDLPDEIDVFRYVEMTSPQSKGYKEMQRDLITEIDGEEIVVNVALAKLMKLRQISGGFAYNREGKAIEFKDNPKMKELENVINEIGQSKSIIIFCQYRFEIEEICRKYGDRAFSMYGATPDKDANIKGFKEEPGRILVAHPLSAGVGLSFNECDYMIFYSLDYSYMNYHQCRGRIMRANKKNNATYIHLIANKTLDSIIFEAVKTKRTNSELFRKIMKGVKRCRKSKS